MLASQLIALEIEPLRSTDTGDVALQRMEEHLIRHLPIVEDGELLGLISEEEILDNDQMISLNTYLQTWKQIFIRDKEHILIVMEMMNVSRVTAMPVLDERNKYVGLITLEKLMHSFATESSLSDPGSILVLEMSRIDYSLTNISRVVESENGYILSSYITHQPDSEQIYVTIKVSLQEVQFLRASLERYGFEVKGTFTEGEYIDTLTERYESLMHFLSI